MYQANDYPLAGGGGVAAFAPAKWPVVAMPAAVGEVRPRDRIKVRLWQASSLLLLAGTACGIVLAYDGPSVGPLPRAASAVTPAAAPALSSLEAPVSEGSLLLVGIMPGEPIDRAMARAGVGAGEAAKVRRALRNALYATDPAPGTQLRVHLGERPNFLAARPLLSARYQTSAGSTMSVARTRTGFAVEAEGLTAAERPRRWRGVVGADLLQSLRDSGLAPASARAFVDALRSRISLASLRASDRFLAVTAPSGAPLLVRLDRAAGGGIALMPWTGSDGRTAWYDMAGAGTAETRIQRPVPGPVSSGFGVRLHPILGFWRMHKGVDFRAASGTPIVATMDGRVAAAGWHGGYGRQVRIEHGGGLVSTYSHMSAIAVAPGALVRQGDRLGDVGSSGLSTGPHLHYELSRGGTAIDPLSIGSFGAHRLSGTDLDDFRLRMRHVMAAAAETVSAAPQTPLRL
ncbi:M23 family metallopeptidase [Allosphingosinicella deserti]|nr:M23 family metallopeptidase [Sphingomonas deserti]